jgi:PAT family beta-lactamase induction signal transducer AmpG
MNEKSTRSPWLFVPSLYFAEGVPYVIINQVSVILYKKMGIDNTQIALWTSFLYLPWVIKMLWGPLVDMHGTKRGWIISTQLAMMLLLGAASVSLGHPHFFFISLSAFTVGAFISATHDIAVDGYYLMALEKDAQAFFVGIRTFFYRAAMIFGTGVLVTYAGHLETSLKSIPKAWMTSIALSAVIFAFLFLYHRFILPCPREDDSRRSQENRPPFLEILLSWFKQERVWAVLGFILLYRLGEALLLKLASPFLLDEIAKGGLGLTTAQVGKVYGVAGVTSLIVGGILGGMIIARFGLRRCLWPMAIILNIPHLAYTYMAFAQPGVGLAYFLVAIEQFGYGLGFTAYTVYLMHIAKGEYKTSHFAVSTGFMALGMMLPGMVSGALQTALGYKAFFILVLILGIPGLLVLPFIPLSDDMG